MNEPTPRDPMVPGLLRRFADHAARGANIVPTLRQYATRYARAIPPEGGDLAGVANLLNDISMSDDLAAQGPAINALSLRVRAHRCAAPTSEPRGTAS
jgi:hypothetical protein